MAAWTKLCAALLVLRSGAYRTGDRPVLGGDLKPPSLGRRSSGSVAQRTEQQAGSGVTIKYVSLRRDTHGVSFAERRQRKTDGEDDAYWEEQSPGKWEFGEWVTGVWKADKSAGSMPPWLKDTLNEDGSVKKPEELVPTVGGGLKRCGFSWDDAAAKVGTVCTTDSDCIRPDESIGLWPSDANYSCFADVPNYERGEQGECQSAEKKIISDIYCQQVCGAYPGAWCDPEKCECIKNSQAWNLSAPIQDLDHDGKAEDLPNRSSALVEAVRREWDAMPSGLPACGWRPGPNCTNETQYECTEGPMANHCSETNWFGNTSHCARSCVHVRLLKPAPYYALWVPGPEARPYMIGERHPRYQHDSSKLTPERRGMNLFDSDVLLSRLCHSESNKFVGITLYSPQYESKASRLVRSCERVGICCKATQLPSHAFGPNAPEGSEEFRFETIAMKPSFILSQLEATALPVVFLDTDLEFHRFPNLFMPGSWPDFDRDVLLFNYWGNETLPQTKNRPNIGSAVAFFNSTNRSKAILTAWAQAMAYSSNSRAPDDQVLDLLLSQGEWLQRASFGWVPSSYLRTMPSYYRGVVAVIDHDHGSAPGLIKHSESKPVYPPVLDMELCEWWNSTNAGRPRYLSVEETTKEVQDDAYTQLLCSTHGLCDGQTSWWNPNPAPVPVPDQPIYKPSTGGSDMER
jgi:hypothetical protein